MGATVSSAGNLFIGKGITGGTSGSVLYVDSNGNIAQENSNLFWDATNNRLGINTTAPDSTLELMLGSATDLGLIIQSAASQTANSFQLTDSGGDIILAGNTNATIAGFFKIATTNKSYGASTSYYMLSKLSTTTFTGGNCTIAGFTCQGEFNFQANSPFGLPGVFFQFFCNVRFSGTANLLSAFAVYAHQSSYIADGVTMAAAGGLGCFVDNPGYSIANSGSWGTNGIHIAFQSSLTVNAGVTWDLKRSYYVTDTIGAGTIVTQVGLDVASLSKATNNYAIRTGASGEIRFGNKITLYNNIATVSNGVPSELATVDLTTQAAAISATTIYTPAATGMFRISIYLQVTRAATSSSILGGATGVVITYNDGDGNVAQSVTCVLNTNGGAMAAVNSGNTTATNLNGSIEIYARTGVAIQYAIGYTSSGATTMQFAAHLKVEAL